MATVDTFRKIALSFPGVTEHPHFDIPSFRVKDKIFATIWLKDGMGMLRLSPEGQSAYCDCGDGIFSPVPGGWGTHGATLVELKKVKKDVLKEALAVAYDTVAAKK